MRIAMAISTPPSAIVAATSSRSSTLALSADDVVVSDAGLLEGAQTSLVAACALLAIHAQARPAPMQDSQLPQGPPSIPSLRVESDDHACTTPYAFGRAIGVRFAQEVATRVSKSRDLAALRTCVAEGGERAAILQEMWRANEQTFPRFAAEVNGTADGAGVSRDDLVLLNLRKELRYVCASYMKDIPHVTHCSDQLVAPLDVQMPRVVGHNEDGACEDAGLLYWVDAPVGCGGGDITGNDDGARFAAITYAGELPSAAFGLNSYGVAVTFNALSPLRLSPVSEAPPSMSPNVEPTARVSPLLEIETLAPNPSAGRRPTIAFPI